MSVTNDNYYIQYGLENDNYIVQSCFPAMLYINLWL